MIGKPIGIKAWGRVVLDPIGGAQSRAAYELQAIAYARWIARRERISLRLVHSAQCIWARPDHISRVEFLRGKRNARVLIEIPNPNPDLAHRCWSLSLLAGAA